MLVEQEHLFANEAGRQTGVFGGLVNPHAEVKTLYNANTSPPLIEDGQAHGKLQSIKF